MSALAESLDKVADLFPRRFFFNALLPTAVYVTLTIAVCILCLARPGTLANGWLSSDLFTRLVIAFLFVAVIWLLASAVASQWRGIVRLYEGYPLRAVAGQLGRKAVGVSWHQSRLALLRSAGQSAAPERAYYRYPASKHAAGVLPTRLGNILLAAERYPLDRYGIDSIVFWPRLYPLLPEQFQHDYEEFVLNFEFPLVMSFLSAVCTSCICSVMLYTHQAPGTFIVALLGGYVVAYMAYLLGLPAAEEVAEQQRTAFDLYRDRLLEAWPSVADITDEQTAFEDIRDFVLIGAPPSWDAARAAHQSRRP